MKALRASQLLDVASGRLISSPTIIIENDRIVGITSSSSYPDIPFLDLPELTLLPGLIDSHTHITYHYDPNGRYGWNNPSSEMALEYGLENAQNTIQAGFTTIRDVGATDGVDLQLRELINSDRASGPRMLISGEPIFHPEDGVRQAQNRMNSGVNVIKIFNDGQFTENQIRDVVRSTSLPVSAHSFYSPEIINSSNGGCVSIEHGSFLNQEAAQTMARNGTSLIPTLSMPHHYLNNRNRFRFSPANWEHFERLAQNNLAAVRLAKQSGINIVFGTDAVAGSHGHNANEFILLNKAGLTPLEAIQTATINPAQVLQVNDIGQILPGYKADLIGVIGNPLEDLRVLHPENIKFVMKNGRIVKP